MFMLRALPFVVVVDLFIAFENNGWCEEFFLYVPMMQFWMMFFPVVGVVHLARSPVYSELLLTFTVL